MNPEFQIKDKTKPTEGLKISPFRSHIRKTSPHKHHNYFEIIYLIKGSGTHTIDTKTYPIKSRVIFTVRKEQIHFWDITTEPQGFVLIIKKTFINDCLDKEIKPLISALSAHTCLFSKDQIPEELFKILHHEQQGNKKQNRALIEGLLKALLAKFLESVVPKTLPKGNPSVFQKYISLLSQENELTNTVKHYARLLNTTPQNLNAICRKETAQSAAEILSLHIINEAKRLLVYSDITVSEIAHRLHFKDNSHFSKYFKRYVRKTPTEFRTRSH